MATDHQYLYHCLGDYSILIGWRVSINFWYKYTSGTSRSYCLWKAVTQNILIMKHVKTFHIIFVLIIPDNGHLVSHYDILYMMPRTDSVATCWPYTFFWAVNTSGNINQKWIHHCIFFGKVTRNTKTLDLSNAKG